MLKLYEVQGHGYLTDSARVFHCQATTGHGWSHVPLSVHHYRPHCVQTPRAILLRKSKVTIGGESIIRLLTLITKTWEKFLKKIEWVYFLTRNPDTEPDRKFLWNWPTFNINESSLYGDPINLSLVFHFSLVAHCWSFKSLFLFADYSLLWKGLVCKSESGWIVW